MGGEAPDFDALVESALADDDDRLTPSEVDKGYADLDATWRQPAWCKS